LKADGIIFHNASTNVVNFLKANMSLPHAAYAIAIRQLQRVFWEIKVGDVNRNHGFDCRIVIGSHSMHSIRSMSHRNNVLLQVRDFSYFCCHCINGTPSAYVSIDYVKPWKLVSLKPCDTSNVLCDMELDDLAWGMGSGRNGFAANLEVGDNFTIRAKARNEEGADFYILKCLKPLHIVEFDVGLDDWQQYVEVGDEIMIGWYYKQSGWAKTSFVLVKY